MALCTEWMKGDKPEGMRAEASAQKSWDFQQFFVLALTFERHEDNSCRLMFLKIEMDVPELQWYFVSIMLLVLFLEHCTGHDMLPLPRFHPAI